MRTPPESTLLPKMADHDTRATLRLEPLTFVDKAKPAPCSIRTPPRQIVSSEPAKFTPFHDIKRDIDNLIGELPSDFAGLAKSNDEVAIERLETRSRTQLSIYLYSPSKKSSGRRRKNFDLSDQHDVLHEPIRNNSQVIDWQVIEKHHTKSLFKRAKRQLKNAIMSVIPRVADRTDNSGRDDKSTSTEAGPGIRLEATNGREIFKPRISRMQAATKDRSFAMLPVITVGETFAHRSPEDITSTQRKPVSSRRGQRLSVVIQRSPRRLPKVNQVSGGTTQAHSPHRIQSQVASICDMMTLQHEIALAGAPIAVKAAASLCVMAIAAGADFLSQDARSKANARRTKAPTKPIRMPTDL